MLKKKPSFSVYSQLLGGDPDPVEMRIRANRMGYEIDGNKLTSKETGEEFFMDPESVTAQLAKSGRDAARLAGGALGGIAGMSGGPVTAAAGGVSGSMIGGSLYDMAVGDQEDPMEQFARDSGEEAVGLLGGKLIDSVSPYVRSGAEKGYLALRDGIKSVSDRIFNEQPASVVLNPKEEISELVDAIATGKTSLIEVNPDPEIMRAAERMGLVLQPDQMSNNARFIEVMQALKSGQGSALRDEEVQVLGELQKNVDDLIDSAGNADVAGLSDDLLSRWQATEKSLARADSLVREKIKIPNTMKWRPLSMLSKLEEKRAEGPLTGLWKKVDSMLKKSDYKTTYNYLDNIRKTVGEGYKGKGQFGDSASHELDEVYGALSEDQFRAARVVGLDKELALANKITQKKKQLQERMTTAFGKDLSKSLTSLLSTSVTRAVKGDLTNWRRMMKMVPAEQRPEVAAAGLQYLLTGGKNRVTKSFVDRYEMLMKNKTARDEIFSMLPENVVNRLEDIYQVSKGIYRSLEQRNNSKTARDLIVNMDLERGFVNKLNRHAMQTAGNAVHGGLGTAIGIFSPQPKTFSKEAEMVLASPKFKAMMEAGVRQKNLEAAEKAFMSTPLYKRWEGLQADAVKDSIAAQGLFKYLMADYQARQ